MIAWFGLALALISTSGLLAQTTRKGVATEGKQHMKPECTQVLEHVPVRMQVVNNTVEIEIVNRYTQPVWVPAEAVPAYKVDPQTKAVQVTYGYFEDVYKRFRAQYMLPPMREVVPGQAIQLRIEDAALLENLLQPKASSFVRLRLALQALPQSNKRGAQPVDLYLENSCPIFSKATVLRP